MDTAELLMQFHLTRQEAVLYLTLLSDGMLSGYEAAKRTGISRSNTYTSLAALVEKGAAYTSEGAVIRYSPVPLQEFCENRIRGLDKTKEDLLRAAPQRREEAEGYLTIRGQGHILDKMRNMVEETKERVYISAPVEIHMTLLSSLQKGLDRGIKTVLITDEPFRLEGATVHLSETNRGQIRLITDSSNVLTGDVEAGEDSTCLYSKKKNLIDLLKESLKNEIRLIELTKGK